VHVMATLIINRDESICGDCKGGADPTETFHFTRLGFPSGLGCRATFTETATHSFLTPTFTEGVRNLRPDLPFIGYVGTDARPARV